MIFLAIKSRGGGEGCSHRLRDALSIIPVLTILTLAFSLCIGMAGAPDSDGDDGDAIVEDGLTYEITGAGEVSVAKCDTSKTSVTIPATVQDGTYTVVSIGDGAFKGCSELETLIFNTGDRFTSIGSLEATDGQGAFQGCSKLANITWPSRVTSIGAFAFSGTGFVNIDIPSTVTSLGNGAFSECGSLQYVSGDVGVQTIGEGAFRNCQVLDAASNFGNAISIGKEAFSGCVMLSSFSVGPKVESVGTDAFKNCGKSTESKSKGDGINLTIYCNPAKAMFKEESSIYYAFIGSAETIGESAFEGCTGLLGVSVSGDKCKTIGKNAFKGCEALYSFRFQSFAKTYVINSIGQEAFSGCKMLSSFTIYASVTSVGTDAFYDCGTSEYSTSSGKGIALEICCNPGEEMFRPGEDTSGGTARRASSIYSVSIQSGVTSIGEGAFRDCSALSTVTFSSQSALSGDNLSLTIGKSAFSGTGITEVTIPSRTTSIGNGAFYNCASLSSVSFEDGSALKSIGSSEADGDYGAFQGCSNLTKITLPDGLTAIGALAFCNTGLTSITLPSSVESLGDGAFRSCGSLLNADLSKSSITRIEDPPETSVVSGVFLGCEKLSTVSLPTSLEYIGINAFKFTGLTELNIPDSVTEIGSDAFFYCELVSIHFGNKVQKIAEYAFGTGSESTKFFKGDRTTLLNLSDVGEFQGWTFTGDMESMFRVEGYTLTFDPDNGEKTWTVTLSPFATIEEPTAPEKTGYKFLYWSEDGETKFDFVTETMPARDMTLKALWEPVMLTVTYVTGTGTDPTETCQYGVTITLPDGKSGSIVITRSGYTLVEWQGADGTVYLPGAEYTVTSDVAFTAVWKASSSPGGDDDDDPYVPDTTPETRGGSDAETGTSVAAVAIAAGCAAALLVLLAMLGRAGSKD